MPLITDEYRMLNRTLHQQTATYGASGVKNAKYVVEIANAMGLRDILDYGCGKGTLGECLTIPIKEYDPCVEGKDAEPEPAEFVVCTDVLEHIEPDCLDNVLDDLKRVTRKVVLLVVSTIPASKMLPDGRNAHLLVQNSDFWLPQLLERWQLHQFDDMGREFKAVMKVRD